MAWPPPLARARIFSVMVMGLPHSRSRIVFRFLLPFGRPLGLPLWPGRQRHLGVRREPRYRRHCHGHPRPQRVAALGVWQRHGEGVARGRHLDADRATAGGQPQLGALGDIEICRRRDDAIGRRSLSRDRRPTSACRATRDGCKLRLYLSASAADTWHGLTRPALPLTSAVTD